jgi:TfoX/Sxy family transcriptional regulator of competence genes
MATAASFLAHVMDQLAGVDGITSRKMFGEYALYKDGKVVALLADNQVFVKPTAAGRAFIGAPVEAPPYQGAKLCFVVADALEEAGWLAQLLRLTADELPLPKAKTPRAKSTKSTKNKPQP